MNNPAAASAISALSFGDPVSVLDQREFMNATECWSNGKWYDPPISLEGLARAVGSSPHHSSALYVKRNLLVGSFRPNPSLSVEDFARFALDFLIFGNAYLQRLPAQRGQATRYKPLLAKRVRRGVKPNCYFLKGDGKTIALPEGSVAHLMEPDIHQEIYGVPEYLSALQAVLLNEAATLYRRRYYLNGCHAGFILYMSDPAHSEADIDAMREALRNAKGPGNFKNLFLYSPNGKKDGVQVIPISEVAAKDEFIRIKETSRDDVLAAHRAPPQMMGIVPKNAGGFGDIEKARASFVFGEIAPLQARIETINELIGDEIIRFNPA